MQISGGSELTVSPGQISAGNDVLSGGQLFVKVSGTAVNTTVEHGGVVQVLGGLTQGDTILGGEEMVYFGTALVSSGGSTVAISGAGTAIGLTITSRGLAVLNSGGFAQNAAIDQQRRARCACRRWRDRHDSRPRRGEHLRRHHVAHHGQRT